MHQRLIGFDLARAYAIFGMFIVNFNFCFGSFQDQSKLGRFMNLFVGNSTAIFIILAGMGVSLMTSKAELNKTEKSAIKSVILKRSWFLVALGLLLYNWWPGDILHFYGGYLHIAAFILFLPKKYYLLGGILAVIIFHILLQIIPIETSWNFSTFEYSDFWTPLGFLRNTFYNGWNSIFPWFCYFMIGLFLGKLDWKNKAIQKVIFLIGLILFILIVLLRYLAKQHLFDENWTNYIMSEYFPAYLPFVLITIGFALMVIPICMFIAEKFPANSVVLSLAKTGKMTLSFYVIHITAGMLIFSNLTHHSYTGYLTQQTPVKPIFIFSFAIGFYLLCVIFSILWLRKFKNGPLETLMRKISN